MNTTQAQLWCLTTYDLNGASRCRITSLLRLEFTFFLIKSCIQIFATLFIRLVLHWQLYCQWKVFQKEGRATFLQIKYMLLRTFHVLCRSSRLRIIHIYEDHRILRFSAVTAFGFGRKLMIMSVNSVAFAPMNRVMSAENGRIFKCAPVGGVDYHTYRYRMCCFLGFPFRQKIHFWVSFW